MIVSEDQFEESDMALIMVVLFEVLKRKIFWMSVKVTAYLGLKLSDSATILRSNEGKWGQMCEEGPITDDIFVFERHVYSFIINSTPNDQSYICLIFSELTFHLISFLFLPFS